MSEKGRVIAVIARIEAKRDAQTDRLCRWYYEQCLKGWGSIWRGWGSAALARWYNAGTKG